MSRNLSFEISGEFFSVEPEKVDRSKLYGTRETLALDDSGKECFLASMDESGTVIIPSGGTASGNLSADGRWVERGELTALNADGTKAVKLPSSYSAPVPLTSTVSATEYLEYAISAFYQLKGGDKLAERVGDKIYAFDYRYNDSYNSNKAFLMVSNGALFMLIGNKTDFAFTSLKDGAEAADEQEEEEVSEEIDFGF